MNTTTLLFHSTMAVALIGSSVSAQEVMTTAQLDALISGNTLYVEVPAGAPGAPDGGTAPIYFNADGTAAARLPVGMTLVGSWTLEDGSYCVDWENGPTQSCSQLSRGAEGFTVLNVALGEPRGTITRIAIGNPEDL